MFKVSARTVLALGAELISSDIVAFYELIKNAIDAKSPDGAEIRFEIVMRRADYLKFRQKASDATADINQLKIDVCEILDESPPENYLDHYRAEINRITEPERFVEILDEVYARGSRIIVSDTGTGMSEQELVDNYLTIGTASRKRAVDAALADHSLRKKPVPYLGEKGIGRLSVMRLGGILTVETAQKNDNKLNILAIDWSEFEDLDATLDQINIIPKEGELKPDPHWSGTRLIIGALAADWTKDRVKELCENDFSRLTDPFADTKRRPTIAVFWNGTRMPVARMDQNLLAHAHASVKGQFVNGDAGLELKCTFEALNLNFDHPYEDDHLVRPEHELRGLISGTSGKIPFSALEGLGEFYFEAYWFNRKRLRAIDSIGNLKEVRDLQSRWSGILLYRDGFRVLPYGDFKDDWLDLNRRALGSKGYLLNKSQFVGRVTISRLLNPELVDQTNRQGLRDCPEQKAFVELLSHTIQKSLRDFLKDVESRYKPSVPSGTTQIKTDISRLEERAKASLENIRCLVPDSGGAVNELQEIFAEIKESFSRTQSHMQTQITEVENEKHLMVQMAGVGLLVEVVAHELARSTENTLAVLKALHRKKVPDQIRGLLNSLRSEMISINKRLRVLDPLSISGRQREERFSLDALLQDILSSHERQFKRHDVRLIVDMKNRRINIRAVKGMIIQIVENLISNSLYWLDLRGQHEPDFNPEITISVEADPLIIAYQDNGHGIAKENRERVFRAFFSLKEKSKRRGLGLYIARECAEYHGGSLTLDKEVHHETNRLHRFILELPSEAVVS